MTRNAELADALERRMDGKSTAVFIGLRLLREVISALREAEINTEKEKVEYGKTDHGHHECQNHAG